MIQRCEIEVKLSTIRIPCQDLELAEHYYSHCVGWQKSFGSVTDGFIGFDLSGISVILEIEEVGEFECGRYLGFSVSVANIDDYYLSARERNVEFTGPPEDQTWGGRMTHIKDCSGNTFTVIESN